MKAMFKKMAGCDVENSAWDNIRSLLWQLVYLKSAEEYEDTKEKVYSRSYKQFQVFLDSHV